MDVHPVGGILRAFEAVPDPRRFNVTYTLAHLLTCTLMAVLCRCDDYEEIADWVAVRHAWLVEVLRLPADRSPRRKTFERPRNSSIAGPIPTRCVNASSI